MDQALVHVRAAYRLPCSGSIGDTLLILGECHLTLGHREAAREALLEVRHCLEEERVPDPRLLMRVSRALAECGG